MAMCLNSTRSVSCVKVRNFAHFLLFTVRSYFFIPQMAFKIQYSNLIFPVLANRLEQLKQSSLTPQRTNDPSSTIAQEMATVRQLVSSHLAAVQKVGTRRELRSVREAGDFFSGEVKKKIENKEARERTSRIGAFQGRQQAPINAFSDCSDMCQAIPDEFHG